MEDIALARCPARYYQQRPCHSGRAVTGCPRACWIPGSPHPPEFSQNHLLSTLRIRGSLREEMDLTGATAPSTVSTLPTPPLPAFCCHQGFQNMPPSSDYSPYIVLVQGGPVYGDQRMGGQKSICLRMEVHGPGGPPLRVPGRVLVGLLGDSPSSCWVPCWGVMLLVTDQDTVPKGARKAPRASRQGVKYKPIPTDPRETPNIQRSQGTFKVSQTAGEAGKGEKEKVSRGARGREAGVSGWKYKGLRGHILLVGGASLGLQINYSILDTGNGVR